MHCELKLKVASLALATINWFNSINLDIARVSVGHGCVLTRANACEVLSCSTVLVHLVACINCAFCKHGQSRYRGDGDDGAGAGDGNDRSGTFGRVRGLSRNPLARQGLRPAAARLATLWWLQQWATVMRALSALGFNCP